MKMHLPAVSEPATPAVRDAIVKLNLVLPKLSSVEHVRSCPGLAKLRIYTAAHIEELPSPYPADWEVMYTKLSEMNASKATIDWKRNEFCSIALSEIHGDCPCPYEQQAVFSLIEQLSQLYDITDGRIIMIVRELCQQLMISMRIEGVMGNNDLFPLVIGKGGKQFQTTHPSLAAKREYSKVLIDTLKALDEITRNKFSVTVEGSFSMAELLTRIKAPSTPQQPREVIVNGPGN